MDVMLLLPSPMTVMIRHNIWTYFFYYSSFYFLEQECWNIAKLDSILATLAEETGETYAGVNSAYVYFGMWKATFSWHVEDMDVSGRFHRMFYDFFLHLIKSIWFFFYSSIPSISYIMDNQKPGIASLQKTDTCWKKPVARYFRT